MTLLNFFFILIFNTQAHSADRLYTADEVSNTVSVIDPVKDELLGVIHLGRPRPFSLNSFVQRRSQINVHGLDISPDHKTLAVISNITNSVTFINTQTTKIIRTVYVRRSPHTANFTPDGKELWVNIRGENFISIIDTKTFKIKGKIKTSEAPSFTIFIKNKNYAFVSNAWNKKIEVFDYKNRKLVKNIEIDSHFSPVMSLSPNQKEIWLVQKDINKVLRINTETLKVIDSFHTGNYTQHTQFLKKDDKSYGLVTVGGENRINVYSYNDNEKNVTLIKSIPIAGIPHGVWASPNGDKIYVALEHGDKLVVIGTSDFLIKKEISIGQSPQAIIYVTDSVNETTSHEIKLEPLHDKWDSKSIFVKSPNSSMTGSVALRSYEYIDYLTFNLFKIDKEMNFKIYLTSSKDIYSKVQQKDLILIGFLKCKVYFTCISESNFPKNENFRKIFTTGRVYFVDEKSNEVVLLN